MECTSVARRTPGVDLQIGHTRLAMLDDSVHPRAEKPPARCSACGAENPADARFCMGCGAPLDRRCGACGVIAPSGARFCMSCGGSLAAEDGADAQAGQAPEASDSPAGAPDPDSSSELEERRKVTVLFADLSGYTAVAERMDPEAVKSLVERSLRRLGEEVDRYGGTRRQVHRRQRDGGLRRAGRARGRRRARGARGARHAGGDGRDQRAARPSARASASRSRRRQHRRGGRGRGRRRLHGDRRHASTSPRGCSPRPGPGASRSASGPTAATARGDRVPAARAAGAEGQGRARARLGGGRRCSPRSRPAPAAARARRRWSAAPTSSSCSSRSTSASQREARPAPGDGDRPGRRRQVAAAAASSSGSSRAREPPPTFREGRCLPYGSGIVYWALGEVIRAEAGIVDGDSPTRPGASCRPRSTSCSSDRRRPSSDEPGERKAAVIGRLLGIERRPSVAPPTARTRSACARRSSRPCAR